MAIAAPRSAVAVFWRSSLVAWLLVASLLVNALAMDPRTSVAGAMVRMCAWFRHYSTRPTRVLVWRDAAGVVHAGGLGESEAAVAALPPLLNRQSSEYWLWWPRPHLAIWTPIVERQRFRLEARPAMGVVATRNPAYRAAASDYLASEYPGVLPPGLRTADVTVSTFKPGGLVANALALASAAALGLWLTQRIRSGASVSLTRARVASGLCPHCAYPVAGHDSPVCPECGGAAPG